MQVCSSYFLFSGGHHGGFWYLGIHIIRQSLFDIVYLIRLLYTDLCIVSWVDVEKGSHQSWLRTRENLVTTRPLLSHSYSLR